MCDTAGADAAQRSQLDRHLGGFDHNAQALRIVTRLEKRYARYDGLNLAWEGFPHLGVWTKPNLGPEGTPAFLCIEPWQGYADPEGFAGEFTEKPGSFLVAPGGTREWSFSVEMAHPTDQKRS